MALAECPACGAKVPGRAGCCTACGVALGEDNRCNRCLAVASVFERTGRHVCSACGEVRTCHPGTVVASEADLLQAFEPPSPRLAPASAVLLALLALGVTALGLLRWLPVWLAGALFVALLAGTARAVYEAHQHRKRQRGRRRYEIEQRIIGLAFRNDGLLSASAVSSTLRITKSEADELLGELVAAGRARAETLPHSGETRYLFGEAKRTRGIRRGQPPAA